MLAKKSYATKRICSVQENIVSPRSVGNVVLGPGAAQSQVIGEVSLEGLQSCLEFVKIGFLVPWRHCLPSSTEKEELAYELNKNV